MMLTAEQPRPVEPHAQEHHTWKRSSATISEGGVRARQPFARLALVAGHGLRHGSGVVLLESPPRRNPFWILSEIGTPVEGRATNTVPKSPNVYETETAALEEYDE